MNVFRKRLFFVALSVLIALLVMGLVEIFRNKGEIVISGTAMETNRVVTLNFHIRNTDRRTPLSRFSIDLNVGNNWNVIDLRGPQKRGIRTNVFGPESQWKTVSIDLAESVTLEPGMGMDFEISLSRQAGKNTNAIDGNVSYLGAVIWEKVGKGQRNTEYFSIPITTTP